MQEQRDQQSISIDMASTVYNGSTNGTGRTEEPARKPVLLSPIEFRRPVRYYYVSPSTFSSPNEYEDEEDWYTPSPILRNNMDMYSSGGHGVDINTSSEVDDDMDFYEADSSQPAIMADAVRSFDFFSSHSS